MSGGNLPKRYVVSSNPTNGFASLPSSSDLTAGWQTDVVDNTTNLCDEYHVSLSSKLGTSPTAQQSIELWAFADIKATGVYLGGFGATSAAVTIARANLKPALMRPIAQWILDGGVASGDLFLVSAVSLKLAFGEVPAHFGFWLAHNTGANLDSGGGNHVVTVNGIGWQYT